MVSFTYDLTARKVITMHITMQAQRVMYVGLGRRPGVGHLGYQHDQIYLYPSYTHPYVVAGEDLANTYANPPNKSV